MRTERIEVADGVELGVDGGRHARPRVGSAGADVRRSCSSTAWRRTPGLWDGVAARLVRPRPPGRDGRPARSRPIVEAGHGYDVPTVAGDLATLIDELGLERPVRGRAIVGRQRRARAGRRAGPTPSAGSPVSTAAGSSRRPTFPDWEACRAALAPPRLVGPPAGRDRAAISGEPPRLAGGGDPGTLANFEVRPDGTIAPWLTYDRHLLVLRGLWDHHPSERFPAIDVPVLLLPADSGRGRSARPEAGFGRRGRGGASRGPGSTGSSATTTSTPSIRTKSATCSMHA